MFFMKKNNIEISDEEFKELEEEMKAISAESGLSIDMEPAEYVANHISAAADLLRAVINVTEDEVKKCLVQAGIEKGKFDVQTDSMQALADAVEMTADAYRKGLPASDELGGLIFIGNCGDYDYDVSTTIRLLRGGHIKISCELCREPNDDLRRGTIIEAFNDGEWEDISDTEFGSQRLYISQMTMAEAMFYRMLMDRMSHENITKVLKSAQNLTLLFTKCLDDGVRTRPCYLMGEDGKTYLAVAGEDTAVYIRTDGFLEGTEYEGSEDDETAYMTGMSRPVFTSIADAKKYLQPACN